eukprot:11829376-Alexandrium_andersonii.AAC.1
MEKSPLSKAACSHATSRRATVSSAPSHLPRRIWSKQVARPKAMNASVRRLPKGSAREQPR